jgi:PKHD-type hydroxylase
MSYNYKTISNNPEERQRTLYPYCFWNNAFTNEELDKICNLSQVGLSDATISGLKNKNDTLLSPTQDHEVRRSKVAFHSVNENNLWIFERLNSVIEMCNNRWFNFDLNGYDQYQYTEYHSDDRGHYDWHADTHFGLPPKDSYTEMRKLSITLLLNDPEKDFSGGELQLGHEKNIHSIPLQKGTIVLFPSFQLHRVSSVLSGVRKSLVVWVVGPKFR